MDYLKDIISIISKNKIKQIKLISDPQNNQGKIYELYEGIRTNQFKSDRQACKELYGTVEIIPKYRNVKSTLENRLINTLFFIDLSSPSFSNYQRSYQSCYKNLAISKIMMGRGAKNAGIKLSERTLTHAIKFHFTEIIIILLKDLRFHYGGIVGNKRKFTKYNRELNKYLKNYEYENISTEYYAILASKFALSKANKGGLVAQAKLFSEEMELLLDKGTSFSFILHAYLIISLRYQIENNHMKTIEVCRRAILAVNKFPNTSNVHLFTFLFKKLNSLIHLKRYQEAEEVAIKCLSLRKEKKSYNRIITLFLYFVLLFQMQKYQELYELYYSDKEIQKPKFAPIVIQELLGIIEAYLSYFIAIGKIKTSDSNRVKKFNVKRFADRMRTVKKDKRGMNISIIVIQLLFLLQQKNYDEVITGTEALKTYNSKYLRRNDTFRSNCFIKMLLQIPAANFNRIAAERKAKPFFEKLKSQPLEIANQPTEIEMVPYEVLWECVLDSLETKPRTKRIKV